MRLRLSLAAFAASLLVFNTSASAIDVSMVDIGDTYYVYQPVGANKPVIVLRVNRENRSALVRYPDGSKRWIATDDLLTKVGSDVADTATNVGVGLVVLGAFICITNPDACKEK